MRILCRVEGELTGASPCGFGKNSIKSWVLLELNQPHSTGQRLRGRSRTRWRDYTSHLVLNEQESVARNKEVLIDLVKWKEKVEIDY